MKMNTNQSNTMNIPSDDEIRTAIARARKMQSLAILGSFQRLFSRNIQRSQGGQ